MLFNIRDKSFIYLIMLPSSAIILGGIGFYLVESKVDEPSIKNMGDAFWLAITTVTTVGYGEIYPLTTEGRIIATLLLFAGVLTIFGFLSTIASKIIKPTIEVKSGQGSKEEEKNRNNDNAKKNEREMESVDKTNYRGNNRGKQHKYENIHDQNQNHQTKRWLKDNIEEVEELDQKEFANLIFKLTIYYYDQNSLNK